MKILRFDDWPIATKLRLITTAVCMTTVALMCLVWIVYDRQVVRRSLPAAQMVRAKMVAAGVAAAVASDNPRDAAEVLDQLKFDPRLTGVALFDRAGRAFARIEDGRVIFKAEVGAATPSACQVQGVWVRPEYRGRGIAAPGMAAVVNQSRESISPIVSLYVNDFNAPGRATYKRAGFHEVGEFMSVLF